MDPRYVPIARWRGLSPNDAHRAAVCPNVSNEFGKAKAIDPTGVGYLAWVVFDIFESCSSVPFLD